MRPISLVKLLLTCTAFILLVNFAEAAPILVVNNNISEFKQLSTSPRAFACFTDRLGVLNRPATLSVGLSWSDFSQTGQERAVSKLRGQWRRAKGQKKRSLKKSLDQAVKVLDQGREFASSCLRIPEGPPPEGEFLGNSSSLAAYRDKLSNAEVQHILERVAFGGSSELFRIGKLEGRAKLVDALVDGLMSSSERTELDKTASYWSKEAFYFNKEEPGYENVRIWTTEAVQLGQLARTLETRDPLREWILFQLSHHFAVNLSRIGFSYDIFGHYGIELHWKLLKDSSLSSLNALTKAFLRDPAMNFWLDNKDNRVNEPNQNFARELLELFLLGQVDPLTGASNYDEDSVVAATAFVSGYYESVQSDPLSGKEVVAIGFEPGMRDLQRYPVFNGITGAEVRQSFTAEGFIDFVMYSHPGSARYLSERFAGLMLYPGLPESLVSSLADFFRENRFELKPFLKLVLNSEAFFSEQSRDVCVASPFEQFVRLIRRLAPEIPRVDGGRWLLNQLLNSSAASGQSLFEPPSVFGWKGSCNINRAGAVSEGEGWLLEQMLLNRWRGCVDLMNVLNDIGYPFSEKIGLINGLSVDLILDRITAKIGVRKLTDQERALIRPLFVNHIDEDGSVEAIVPEPDSDWYMRRKIPTAICLIQNLSSSNRN